MLGTAEVVSHSRKSSSTTAYDLMSHHSNESSSSSAASKEPSSASSGIEFESSCEEAHAQNSSRPRHTSGLHAGLRTSHPAKSRSPALHAIPSLQDTVLHSSVIRPPPNITISANPRQSPNRINSTVNHIHQRLANLRNLLIAQIETFIINKFCKQEELFQPIKDLIP